MFYLEVMLDSTGGVKDVRIHHEGKVEQQVSVYHIMRFDFLNVCVLVCDMERTASIF
jgi:mediator of RNA polymerase II transcription subunit 1